METLEPEMLYSPMTKKVVRRMPTAMPTVGIPRWWPTGWKHLPSTHVQKVTDKQKGIWRFKFLSKQLQNLVSKTRNPSD